MTDDGFRGCSEDRAKWITAADGELYPDYLPAALDLYRPVIEHFGELLEAATSAEDLLRRIVSVSGRERVQLLRVFRKYCSPKTPVEMLKVKNKVDAIIDAFSADFRPLAEVREAFASRPIDDEALCALLWEYKDRGKKGYDLTEILFAKVEFAFPELACLGPKRAGADIPIGTLFPDYPHPSHPVDFALVDEETHAVVAFGFARYDSDRGGAQEDDRINNYRHVLSEFKEYAVRTGVRSRLIFVNDGPGLTLGSMWEDYVELEGRWPERVRVVTLKMFDGRITREWLGL